MKFIRNAVKAAKEMPKPVWVAAVAIPFGFTAIGVYLAVKGLKINILPKKLKIEVKNDQG